MKIGPKMLKAAAYVVAHPGCVVRECAHEVNPCPVPSRSEGLGYAIVNRAIAAGLIRWAPHPTRKGAGVLYPPEVSK